MKPGKERANMTTYIILINLEENDENSAKIKAKRIEDFIDILCAANSRLILHNENMTKYDLMDIIVTKEKTEIERIIMGLISNSMIQNLKLMGSYGTC